MQLANVDVRGEGFLLEPTFKEFIDKLALAKPEWTFTFDYVKDGRYATSRCMQQGRQVSEDVKYATRMSVTQNNIHLGVLGIQRNVSGDADKKWSLTVSSDNVQSRRGNTTKTVNMASAIRNAKTYLKCPSLGKIVYERASDVVNRYSNALSRLEITIERGHLLPSREGAQVLLNAFVRNQTPDTHLLSEFSEAMHNPKFENALSEYMLAQHMKSLHTIPICLMDGLYAFFTDNELLQSHDRAAKSEPQLVPFEALPLEWQNRLAVLQLMEDNEVVKDVGYRVDADNFLIVK